jgi:hypothetical protein
MLSMNVGESIAVVRNSAIVYCKCDFACRWEEAINNAIKNEEFLYSHVWTSSDMP